MSRKSRINDVQQAAAREAASRQRRTRLITAIVAAVAVVALIIAGVFLLGGQEKTPTVIPTTTPTAVPEIVPEASHWIEIDIEGYGVITAELYSNAAPITVANFVKLAEEGFYDGLTFHRIIDGFMMQGGCPNGDGLGGSGTNIKGEFASNGVNNPLLHERGVLSMARAYDPDSASSQFFIMHQASPWLDGEYAAFGRVLTGMEIVDAICQNTPVSGDNGAVAREDQPIINSIRVVEIAE